jgi:ABC-type branched-subunit amino acid transport system ATPase component/MFS family permease
VSRIRDRLTTITAGEAAYPLVVLFALNACEELDRTGFGILLPDIRDHFGLSTGGALAIVAIGLIGGLLLAVPIAVMADRFPRTPIVLAGAGVWAVFAGLTGAAAAVWFLVVTRIGAGTGRSVIDPTHNSLLADYYPTEARAPVYAVHRMGNITGQFLGPLLAGLLAYSFGWRVPFFVFAGITAVAVVAGLALREPPRGRWERSAAGADAAVAATEEDAPSFAESMRLLWQVETLRRIWISLPFLAASVVGLVTLTSLLYNDAFGLDERARGFVAAGVEPSGLVGLAIGIPLAARLMRRDPGDGLRMLSGVIVVIAALFTLFALSPWLWLAITCNVLISGCAALLAPGIFASLSLAIPPKARALGFAMASLFILPGLLTLFVIGDLADRHGLRLGLLMLVPILLVGGQILASAGSKVAGDIRQVWTAAAAQAEVRKRRDDGEAKLLLVRGLDVSYDGVQVLFGVDLEVDEGETVALLGTNGAGKSTLLRAINGLVESKHGAIVFDGRDMTYTPPHEVVARGVVTVPGGQGVFPGLTVRENLRLAGWLHRGRRAEQDAAVRRVLQVFPILAERLDERAGNLSGGQQQMLTLGMAFVHRPRLLMIDELSLGLAPTVVEQLLELVRELSATGTTIILVEQSVNLALTVAETAYFMEKGEIRFHGPTADLLERPDILRSVFLEGAAAAGETGTTGETGATPARPRREVTHGEERLRIEGVGKRFGGRAVLADVTVGIRAGEIVGFIGPNGAGKTTLFDIVSGYLAADTGRVVLVDERGDHDLTALSAHRRAWRGLGRSFQDGRLFPQLSVAETIALALERQVQVRDPIAAALHLPAVTASERRIRRRVEELLELLGIGDFRDKLVRELSTGSRRVVDLACLLAHEPSVLLLDEPSTGIAQREAEALGPLLERVRDETGASLLLVEHDLPLLLRTADRLVALDLGVVIADGAPGEVVLDDAVVASYIGTTAAAARSGSFDEFPTVPTGG